MIQKSKLEEHEAACTLPHTTWLGDSSLSDDRDNAPSHDDVAGLEAADSLLNDEMEAEDAALQHALEGSEWEDDPDHAPAAKRPRGRPCKNTVRLLVRAYEPGKELSFMSCTMPIEVSTSITRQQLVSKLQSSGVFNSSTHQVNDIRHKVQLTGIIPVINYRFKCNVNGLFCCEVLCDVWAVAQECLVCTKDLLNGVEIRAVRWQELDFATQHKFNEVCKLNLQVNGCIVQHQHRVGAREGIHLWQLQELATDMYCGFLLHVCARHSHESICSFH